MSVVLASEVLADPIGVIVNLVVGHDPVLDRAVVTQAVQGMAGGRAKQRRLAQALLDRPAVLADGRSPAPRVIADLLIALRTTGAARTSPPVCAECGKALRTFQRRGEDWYCGVCGPRRDGCGRSRPVNIRDRDGHPDARNAHRTTAAIRWTAVPVSARSASAPQTGRCVRPAVRSRR